MNHAGRTPVVEVSERDSVRTWLISDPHFDHTNIIKYCNRPFQTVEEMNQLILQNWNRNVKDEDLVIFVGDMAFGRGSRKPRWWIEQLKGHMIYLKGSHDHGIRPTSEGLDSTLFVANSVILRTDSCSYFLVHDPFNIPHWWKGWSVHGHVHNNRPYLDNRFGRTRVNVSVEAIGYKPITVRQLVADTIKVESS